MQDGTQCRSSWKGNTQTSSDYACSGYQVHLDSSQRMEQKHCKTLASALMFCYVQDMTLLRFVLCCFCLVPFFSLFTAYNSWDTHSLAQEHKRASTIHILHESHFHRQFLGICQSLWKVILESLCIWASPFSDKWYCWKSGALECCCLSAKRPIPLVGRETWTAIWRTIDDWVSSDLCHRAVKTPWVWYEGFA